MNKVFQEAYKRDLKEAGITAKSARRQEREERKEKEREDEVQKQKKQSKEWHQAKDAQGNIYYWNSKTRETRWKPPPVRFYTFRKQFRSSDNDSKIKISTFL